MELETTQTITTAKLPMLKQGNYKMWRLRIEQYFEVQDYALWDVIKNGPVTTKEKAEKNNDVKARSMLLMALSNEHLITFNQYKDAKSLFVVIETKKTQKTLLKQMYENFSATSTYSFDSIFNSLQKIGCQLVVLGKFISQEALNLNFLRSFPYEWNTHVVV
uniref:Ribonuclease H-like domain-containing protein n=1 Tax=Tanacetum cinerariifolium TaxID=118510 RepID=A0A6L2LZG8_TANCI|nr:ribonuclease H-like domain-containing protein [Tanacetum cinerariifolium]